MENEKESVYVLGMRFINVMGLEHYEIKPGRTITRIKAPNASGKTSMASAIVSLSKGAAHESRLLRVGETEGKIVFDFSNGLHAEKNLNEAKSTVSVKNDAGKKVTTSPVALIQQLLNPESVNPVSFFNATPEKRIELLLKAMPVTADPKRLEAITGQKSFLQGNAWDVIAQTRQSVFDERTETNRAAKAKRLSVQEDRNSIPKIPEDVEDVDVLNAEILAIEKEKDSKLEAIAVYLGKFEEKYSQDCAALATETEEKTKSAKARIAEINAKIKELEKELSEHERIVNNEDSERTAKQTALDIAIAGNRAKAVSATESQTNAWKEKRSAINARISTANGYIEMRGALKNMLEKIERNTKDAENLEADSARQTGIIERLDAYKLELMNNLPIKGLEIDKGKLKSNGVEWDGLNEAKKMEISVETASIQLGECPFMFVDGIECLDYKNTKNLESTAKKYGLQLVTLGVDGSPEADGFSVEVE